MGLVVAEPAGLVLMAHAVPLFHRGVGKTTIASAAAVALSDAGRRVLLVSTDPASNLADVFGTRVAAAPCAVPGVPGLEVMNLDPEVAAGEYRERVIGPYRGVASADEIGAIEEQLAGECTVEVAAFDQFTQLLVRRELTGRYDHSLVRHSADRSHVAPHGLAKRMVAVHRDEPGGSQLRDPRRR